MSRFSRRISMMLSFMVIFMKLSFNYLPFAILGYLFDSLQK